MTVSRRAAAVAMTLLLVVAAACGGDDGEDSTASTAPAEEAGGTDDADLNALATEALGELELAEGETSRGVDGSVIRIGGVAGMSDASGQVQLPGACDGAKARFERANEEGGVNGFTFDYVGCTDDTGNPDTHASMVRNLVEEDEVFAVVPLTSAVSDPVLLNEEHVPYFGFGLGDGYCGWSEKAFAFSVASALACDQLPDKLVASDVAPASYLEATGLEPSEVKLAYVGADYNTSRTGAATVEAAAKALGIDVVYAEFPIPPPGAPALSDYSPIINDLQASGATVVLMAIDVPSILAISGGLKAIGYTGDLMNFSLADERILGVDAVVQAADGGYVMTPQHGARAFPSAEMDQVQADLDAISSDAPLGLGTLTSYASADLFLAAFAEIDGDPTTEALANTLNDGFEYAGIDNVYCPSSWPAAHVIPVSCGALIKINAANRAFEPVVPLRSYSNFVIDK